MKILGKYPLLYLNGQINPRIFIAVNVLELFKVILPLEQSEIRIHFKDDMEREKYDFHLTKMEGIIHIAICNFWKNKTRDEILPYLWFVTFRIIRSYINQYVMVKEDLIPFTFYERFGFQNVGQKICNDFTEIGFSTKDLQRYLDSNLVTNVMMRKLINSLNDQKNICPIHDLGPLLLVNRHEYKSLM